MTIKDKLKDFLDIDYEISKRDEELNCVHRKVNEIYKTLGMLSECVEINYDKAIKKYKYTQFRDLPEIMKSYVYSNCCLPTFFDTGRYLGEIIEKYCKKEV